MSAVRPLSGGKADIEQTALGKLDLPCKLEEHMAKATKKKRSQGAEWTKAMHFELRKHSKAKTPVEKISKQMKRSVGALRQQALKLGIGLGHRR